MDQEKIVYPELSYKIMGILFKIHRELGNTYQEKYYQRAIALSLDEAGIPYGKEVLIELIFNNQGIGKYYLDFVIDNKIALEIKTVPFVKDEYYKQLLAYLNATNLKLGIVVNFRSNRLTYKRLINPRVIIANRSEHQANEHE